METARKNGISFPRACRLLKDIDERGFAHLCECLHVSEWRLSDREPFIYETDARKRLGVVVGGAVQLTRQRADGGRSVLETVGPSGVFGATYVFRDTETMGIGATAIGETTVLLVDAERIMRPCWEFAGVHRLLIRNLLTVMSNTTLGLKRKLRILSLRTIRDRLMSWLRFCSRRARSREFVIQHDRQALADYLCVDRSALSAEISKLRAEKVLESEKNRFRLLKD